MNVPHFRKFFPPRIVDLFVAKPEREFHSEAAPRELIEKFRQTVATQSGWRHGVIGRVAGETLHIGWATGAFRDSFAPVFYGGVVAGGAGSTIRGRISVNRIVLAFTAVWCGAIVLFSLVLVWTIIAPLIGYGFLWAANGIIGLGDRMHPGREGRILDYIQETCDSAGQ